MLAVLRPGDDNQARRQLAALLAAGLVHVELAVQPSHDWVAMAAQLVRDYPDLRLGAASVRSSDDLDAAMAAGLGYAVSPILRQPLLRRAQAAGFVLVPGVFTPTEVHQARLWGAGLVKLFPAKVVGPGYWPALRGPLGPLPFCIAAGGLGVRDVEPWLNAGIDAVALGSRLFQAADAETTRPGMALDPELAALVARLG